MICEFIKSNHKEYGLNWLLNKCKINKTSYYNFKKKKELKIKSIVRKRKPKYINRSIIASITDRFITADLAIRTLEKAIKAQIMDIKHLFKKGMAIKLL